MTSMRVYLYPTPLHYRQIPELIDKVGATVLVGTDTFLTGYARNADAFGFRSLRYVIAGAEALKAETRRVYHEKFGLRLFEGYGVTECRAGAGGQHADVQQATARSAGCCLTSRRGSSRCRASRRAGGCSSRGRT